MHTPNNTRYELSIAPYEDALMHYVSRALEKHRHAQFLGTTDIEFELSADGKLLESHMALSSGNDNFDNESLQALQEAATRFPSLPEGPKRFLFYLQCSWKSATVRSLFTRQKQTFFGKFIRPKIHSLILKHQMQEWFEPQQTTVVELVVDAQGSLLDISLWDSSEQIVGERVLAILKEAELSFEPLPDYFPSFWRLLVTFSESLPSAAGGVIPPPSTDREYWYQYYDPKES